MACSDDIASDADTNMDKVAEKLSSYEKNKGVQEEVNNNAQPCVQDITNFKSVSFGKEELPQSHKVDFSPLPLFSLTEEVEVATNYNTKSSLQSPNQDIEALSKPSVQFANTEIASQEHRSLSDRRKQLASRNIRLYKQKIQPFWKITVAQILCVIYILVLTFCPPPVGIKDPASNSIIDPNSVENTNNGVVYMNGSFRPVVAIGGWQKFCLAISRMSAFSMYPMLVVVFVTKMKAIQTFLSKTPLSMYFGVIKEAHDFHAHAGAYIAFDVWLHTLFHLLRWGSQGNIHLLWTSNAGLTGLTTVVVTPLITFPMMYWKKKLSYEVRKALHYLFYVFAIAMCFHVPPSAIPNGGFLAPILGTCIVYYTLDACYVYLFMCEKIETTAFHVLTSGVRISMPTSERFQKQAGRAGFAYINIPWINDKQWHPFSLFEDPSDPSNQQMFLMKNGDWTNAVHTALSRDTTRPCWIKGPFPSPYSHASLYDNQILVASGIGITPALAAINAFKSSRRINLIWAVRDPEMLEFFLDHMYLDHDGWNLIFYTGKKPLSSAIEGTNTNVRVIKGRPQLASVIPNIIYGVESKEGLPEEYTESSKDKMKKLLTQRVLELNKDSNMRATEKVTKLRDFASDLGFTLQDLIDESEMDRSTLKVSFPAKTSSTEDGAKSFLKQLSSCILMDQVDPKLLLADDGATNLTEEKEDNPSTLSDTENASKLVPPKCRPKRHHASMLRWDTMITVVDEKDSNALLMPTFQPWDESKAQEICVKRLSPYIMSTWGIMYCGGSQPVISALREISIDYNIDLHVDSFAW